MIKWKDLSMTWHNCIRCMRAWGRRRSVISENMFKGNNCFHRIANTFLFKVSSFDEDRWFWQIACSFKYWKMKLVGVFIHFSNRHFFSDNGIMQLIKRFWLYTPVWFFNFSIIMVFTNQRGPVVFLSSLYFVFFMKESILSLLIHL